ncbi:MAG: hypothetical protein J7L47_06090 [Candidatus Odinarchaeota archaeon]|nr:hypothetical protein [Candidatus Odinarchaeota archaeon]
MTLPNTTNFVIATPVHQENTGASTNILPLGTMVYVRSFTDFKYVPVIILYDPPGRESYQEVTEETTTSFRVDIESNEFRLYAGGSFTGSQSIKRTYSSSKNTTEPNDIGPGKGDTIVCRYFQLAFDVYRVYESPGPMFAASTELPSPNSYSAYDYVQLKSVRAEGTGLLSRRTLEYIPNYCRKPNQYYWQVRRVCRGGSKQGIYYRGYNKCYWWVLFRC